MKKATTELSNEKPDIKFYLSYARKNGLRQLELLVDQLDADKKELALSAVQEFKMNLNTPAQPQTKSKYKKVS